MRKRVIIYMTIVLFLDQISKYITSSFIDLNSSVKVIKDFFYVSNVHNYGAAWGLLNNQTTILILVNIVALFLIVRYMFQFKKNGRNTLGFGILFGGIIGNFIDRVIFGYVRDFIEFHIFSYRFPTFNISDMAIVIGIFLLMYAVIKGEDKIEDSSGKRSKNKTR